MPTRATILVVDDYDDGLEMYGEFLTFHGYRVLLARSGAEAIKIACADHPDLILMDLEMPRMNGSQALRFIRAENACAGTPIVALTAHAFATDRAQAFRDGFDDVIAKPCLPDELLARIEHLLRAEPQA